LFAVVHSFGGSRALSSFFSRANLETSLQPYFAPSLRAHSFIPWDSPIDLGRRRNVSILELDACLRAVDLMNPLNVLTAASRAH
jgi:hypothetical protein